MNEEEKAKQEGKEIIADLLNSCTNKKWRVEK